MDKKSNHEHHVQIGSVGPASQGKPGIEESSWISPLFLTFLLFNLVMEIYRSINKPWAIAFVVFSYADLIFLFWCLNKYEKVPENSPWRGILKVLVWSLSTTLIAMLSYRVASIMPLAVKLVIGSMAGMSTSGTFYALFIYRDNCPDVIGRYTTKP